MSTFQAIIYGIVEGFCQFLPISVKAHHYLLSYWFAWPMPSGPLAGAMTLGACLALFVYFRHDWAAMISCFLQVLLFRKKPMTLDERMPVFLMIGTAPVALAWYYLHPRLEAFPWTPPYVAGSLVVFSLLLWLGESFSRKNKGLHDWNSKDAALVGITQIALLIPGCGQLCAVMGGALFRNFNREAAAKFAFFLAMPVLGGNCIRLLHGLSFHAAEPMAEVKWLSFIMAFAMAFLTGLLGIGGFMKQVQRKGLGQFVLYRFLMAGLLIGLYWMRTRAVQAY